MQNHVYCNVVASIMECKNIEHTFAFKVDEL